MTRPGVEIMRHTLAASQMSARRGGSVGCLSMGKNRCSQYQSHAMLLPGENAPREMPRRSSAKGLQGVDQEKAQIRQSSILLKFCWQLLATR
jgi:hypothetical protein